MPFTDSDSASIKHHFSIIDYIIFAALLCASSLIGIYFSWRARNVQNSDYFLTGNRKLALFPVTMSLVASFMSTNTLLGVPAEVYQVGTQFMMQVISITIVIVLAAEVFMPIYYRLELTSVNEYLLLRHKSKWVKLAGSIGFLLATIPYMAVVLYGPAIALNSVTPLSITTSILVVGVICTFYTSIGGIKAVIWTDVLQCILMFLGVAIVIAQGLYDLGGFNEAIRITEQGGRLKFFNLKFDLYNHDNLWNVVAGSLIGWGSTYCVSQTQVQRYLSMKSQSQARKTLYYNLPGLVLLAMMSIMSGIVIYGKYRNCDPVTLGIVKRHDQIIPYFAMDTLSKYPGIPGLFVACIFSGSLSTLSSGFNSLAAVTWEDLVKPLWRIENNSSNANVVKFIAMSYGILAIALSFGVGSLGTVFQASHSLSMSMTGPLFGLFTISILFRFVNARGALTGFVCGIAISLTIAFGAIIIPRPQISLPTTYANCSQDIFEAYVHGREDILAGQNKFLTHYEPPEGIFRFFHISYLITSLAGFIVAVTLGIVVSLATGGIRENEKLDSRFLSPIFQFASSRPSLPQHPKVKSNKHQNHDANDNNNLSKNKNLELQNYAQREA